MLINSIIVFCILIISSLSIDAENEKNEVCYLQIICKKIPKTTKQEVQIKLDIQFNCISYHYFFIGKTHFGGFVEVLKTDTTYLLEIQKKIIKRDNETQVDFNCSDTVRIEYQPFFRRNIDDYFIFKANDTIKKVVDKYELLPVEIFDFFKGKNE